MKLSGNGSRRCQWCAYLVAFLAAIAASPFSYSLECPKVVGLCRPAVEGADVVVGGIVITQQDLTGRSILAQGGRWCEAVLKVDHVLKGHVGSNLRIQYFNGAHTLSTNYAYLSTTNRYVLFLTTIDATNSIYTFSDFGSVLVTTTRQPDLPQGEISFAERMDIEVANALTHEDPNFRFRALWSIDKPWFGKRIRAVLPTLMKDEDAGIRGTAIEINGYLNKPTPRQESTSQPPMDFGVVELSDRVSHGYYLGSGQNFTIIPTVLQDGRLNLIVELDQRTNGGTQTHFESTNIQVFADQPVTVEFQPSSFIFTPRIKK